MLNTVMYFPYYEEDDCDDWTFSIIWRLNIGMKFSVCTNFNWTHTFPIFYQLPHRNVRLQMISHLFFVTQSMNIWQYYYRNAVQLYSLKMLSSYSLWVCTIRNMQRGTHYKSLTLVWDWQWTALPGIFYHVSCAGLGLDLISVHNPYLS